MDITRNLSGTRALVVGAGLALALAMGAAPTTALAEGRVGTTDVTIRTEIDNIAFKTPTVIPFVAEADGTRLALQGAPLRGNRIFVAQHLLDLPGTTLVV